MEGIYKYITFKPSSKTQTPYEPTNLRPRRYYKCFIIRATATAAMSLP
jgi:hypothetical protein